MTDNEKGMPKSSDKDVFCFDQDILFKITSHSYLQIVWAKTSKRERKYGPNKYFNRSAITLTLDINT